MNSIIFLSQDDYKSTYIVLRHWTDHQACQRRELKMRISGGMLVYKEDVYLKEFLLLKFILV